MRFLKKGLAYYFLRKSNLPQNIQRYLQCIYNMINISNRPGRDPIFRYVIFDTETTGFNIQKDFILSIGAVAIRRNEILNEDSFYSIIRSNNTHIETIQIHGILPRESQYGENLEIVLLKFLDYLQDSILVGHHIDFDIDFINKFLKSYYGIKLLNYKIDTARLARNIFQLRHINYYEMKSPKLDLDSLCEQYRISTESRHHALGDSYITAELFLKLTNQLNRLGKTKLASWLSLG